MKFTRRRIDDVSLSRVRTLAARSGWLLDTPTSLRAGFGRRVARVDLAAFNQRREATRALARHEVVGDDGPSGSGVVAFAALPFARDEPGVLDVAEFTLTRARDGATWLSAAHGSGEWRSLLDEVAEVEQEPQSPRTLTFQPTPEEYAHQVALAVETLRRKEIDKIVLSRAVLGAVPNVIDPAAVAARLRTREPSCALYALPTANAQRFVGASPELLVRRHGRAVESNPLAGTIALPTNVAPDDYQAWLLGSTKNLHEHGVVVDEIVANLADFCDDIRADAEPSIVTLHTIAHLGTWIHATCRDELDPPDVLDVLRRLHPTSAVGGAPRASALELIARLEGHDRGFFAGPVGWLDASGDGEWWIALRGVLLEGRSFEAWAGAGIVSESDPIAEREETKNKLAVVLSALLADPI